MRRETTRLPEATRDEQLERWGIVPDRVGGSLLTSRRGPSGGRLETCDTDPGTPDDADDAEAEVSGFLREGGWSVATVSEGGGRDHGLTHHRGVLHPDEYVDDEALLVALEAEFGFTVAQVRSVYRQGPMSTEARALRDRIDARVSRIAEAGGHLYELGRALGLAVREDGHCRALENALARARAAKEDR